MALTLRIPVTIPLQSVAGPRTVPIEFGGQYTASDWGQKLMPLSQFIDQHVLAESSGSV